MKRERALTYVSVIIDDALNVTPITNSNQIPKHARLVGWQCGFEPYFVAVYSYLGVKLDDEEAEEIAIDWLREKQWFTDKNMAQDADYIL